jgi:rhodanese-related sulfurtransferase
MGWDVAVWAPDPAGPVEAGPWRPALPPLPEVTLVGPAQVEDWLRAGEALVVDVDTSRRFLAGHVPGAAWALRTDLPGTLPGLRRRAARQVLTSADGVLAAFAAADMAGPASAAADVPGPGSAAADMPGPGSAAVTVLDGGTASWAASGRPLQAGPGEMLSRPVDVYRRPYEGTDVDAAAMRAYLDWEHGLVAQLERDGTHGFTVLTGLAGDRDASRWRRGGPVSLDYLNRLPERLENQ